MHQRRESVSATTTVTGASAIQGGLRLQCSAQMRKRGPKIVNDPHSADLDRHETNISRITWDTQGLTPPFGPMSLIETNRTSVSPPRLCDDLSCDQLTMTSQDLLPSQPLLPPSSVDHRLLFGPNIQISRCFGLGSVLGHLFLQ
jgi:hypothetical protein